MAPPTLETRFTRAFGLAHPICLAPMALATGGELAAAVANAGGLGLVGGGYGDPVWTERELKLALSKAPRENIGVGFITWKLAEDSTALKVALELKPRFVMLSFADPRPYAPAIKAAGAKLICQIQNLSQLPMALEAGADVIVAQGSEAGGHGADGLNGRSTMTLVPEVADYLKKHAPEVLLLAAGGVATGRQVSAAIVLGADGALIGTRFWATKECLAPQGAKDAAIKATGDDTARTSIFDVLRQIAWPAPFNFRALRNSLHRKLETDPNFAVDPSAAIAEFQQGAKEGDFEKAQVTVGECVGLCGDLPEAGELVKRIVAEAEEALGLR